jgi:hypothetical protein
MTEIVQGEGSLLNFTKQKHSGLGHFDFEEWGWVKS